MQRVGPLGPEAVQQQAPGVAARRRERRRRGPPAGLGCWPNSGTPVLKGEVGAELSAPLGAVDQLGGQLDQAGLGGLGGGGAGEAHAHGVAQAAVGGQKRAGLLQVGGQDVRPGLGLGPGMREGVAVFYRLQCRPEGWVKELSCLLDIARTSRRWCR